MSAIDLYAPWAGDSEKALRARLYDSRDQCGARAARTEGWTHHLFKTAEELAADWVWRRAGEEELRRVANAVVRMIQAGTELEQAGSPNA
jgi:hypothetical protein